MRMTTETTIGLTSEPISAVITEDGRLIHIYIDLNRKNETKPKRKDRPGLDDPYEHAPPKPDGDPWAVLLKPEMETDKIRCDAWKDEVSNLLIFAGLFSAVVTAFVIESYKSLQPDPNDTIISLLSQITNGPNTTSPLSAGTSTSIPTSFVRTPSSVAINVLWFISLILSLATVLVGTISLQWLREHQSYPGLSPKETLATLHMRTEALEVWRVPQIFTALPLLLQTAVVFFLVGLIIFTLALGVTLAAFVACFVGLILLFLAATTALPAFQSLLLLSGYFRRNYYRNTVPNPCAFKSPQSQVFRRLSRMFLYLLSFIFPEIYRPKNKFQYYNNIIPESSGQRHLFPYIYTIWHRKTWPTSDSEWLSLRDAWHQGILDKDVDLYQHRFRWKEQFPLIDITQCLARTTTEPTSAKHTEEYLVAACYCFQEISGSVWKSEPTTFDDRIDRRNNYFENIYRPDSHRAWSISNFLIHGGQYKYNAFRQVDHSAVGAYLANHRALFYLDQVYLFLDMLLENHTPTAALERYRLEIHLRTTQNLLTGDITSLVPIAKIDSSGCLAVFNVPDTQRENGFVTLVDSVDLLATTFEAVTSDSHKADDLKNPVYKNTGAMPEVINMLACGIISYLRTAVDSRDLAITDPEAFTQQALQDVGERYGSIFRSVATHLRNEIASEMSTPSLLFHLSAMLLQRFLFRFHGSKFEAHSICRIRDSFRQSLSLLVVTMRSYKDHMAGQNNDAANIRFQGNAEIRARMEGGIYMSGTMRFSKDWWDTLFFDYDDSGLNTIETCPTVPSSTPLDIAPQPSISSPGEARPPDNMPLSPPATPLHGHSENNTHTVDSLSPSHPGASHIPNPPLDTQVGQAVEYPTDADARVLTSSGHSLPETLVRSNKPPDNPPATRDSIIDMHTST